MPGLWSVAAMLNPNPAPREIREKKTNRKITTCFEFPILGAPENRQGHVAVVRRAMFTPDSKSVLSCSDDRSIRMWSMEEETLGELMFVFVQHTGKLDGSAHTMPSRRRLLISWRASFAQVPFTPSTSLGTGPRWPPAVKTEPSACGTSSLESRACFRYSPAPTRE